MKYMCSYIFPEGGRFYVQPYTVGRDVYESRYVVHLRSRLSNNVFSPSREVRTSMLGEMDIVKDNLLSGTTTDDRLVVNALTARYRLVDYLYERAYNLSEEEIFLYTINHNAPEKVLEHLNYLRDNNKRYVLSFFTGEAIGSDPYSFSEGDVLRMNLGTVLDTRSLIRAKFENIYFLLSDNLNELFQKEEFTSETYLIRKTEYSINTHSRIPNYDETRLEISLQMGANFPKFPREFSISERLMSPSGHALRMTLEYIGGKASITMFAEKIVSNFRSTKRTYVKSAFSNKQIKPRVSSFSTALRHHGEQCSSIERSEKVLRRSIAEWIAGIRSAIRMSEPTKFQNEQLNATINFLESSLHCQSRGLEIVNFMERAFGTLVPLQAPRRGLL